VTAAELSRLTEFVFQCFAGDPSYQTNVREITMFALSLRSSGLQLKAVAAAVALASSAYAATVDPDLVDAPFRDPNLAIESRIDDLLPRMTLAEKVAQMQGIWQTKNLVQDALGNFSASQAAKNFPDGIGQISRPGDRVGTEKPEGVAVAGATALVANRSGLEAATYANAAQKWAVEQTRLGIPLLLHEEALHGFVARGATSFPQAIALASSWDPALVERVMSVAAHEMRVRGANLALAPVVDIVRDPRWGRSEETFGEDPYLAGEIGLAAIRGLQGSTLPLAPNKVFATLKHLTGHGQPENGVNVGPAHVGERTLRENFLPPFEKAIRNLPIRSVMASYNEIDGVPSHINRWLLQDVLRTEWGYDGAIVSDYFALKELDSVHKMVASMDEAATLAINAGVDVELPDGEAFKRLPQLVSNNTIPEARIDQAVRRILRMKFEAGLFEHPYVNAKQAERQTATPEAISLAREAAARSIILLKNKASLLPIDPHQKRRLLVIGTHARDTPIGGYSDQPREVISVLDGLRAAKGLGMTIDYAEGVRLTESRVWEQDKVELVSSLTNQALLTEAVAKAKQADLIIMVLGENEQLSREAWAATHLGDRANLELQSPQNALASAIFDLQKPTVVLLLNGRPLSVNLIAERADALLEGWYLGQQTGHGVADVLFGKVAPGGKLPVSIPRSVGHIPVYYSRKPSARRGYLLDDISPLYPFGFGLSYSEFTLSQLKLSSNTIPIDGSVTVSATLRNIGSRRADQVVQLYLRDVHASVTRPMLELKRFARMSLDAGTSKTLNFELLPADFALWNSAMKNVVEPGKFEVLLGFDSVALQKLELELR
jgi:beta-glucosidase